MRHLSRVLALLTCACGTGDSESDHTVRLDSAGVELVSNPGRDLSLDRRFDAVWSVGGHADERIVFSELAPHHVGTDRHGNVYVLDAASHRVLVLSVQGELVTTLGRVGSGPSELEIPTALAVEDDEGGIAVHDYAKGGLVRWSSDREPQNLVRFDVPVWGPGVKISDEGTYFVVLTGEDQMSTRQALVVWQDHATDLVARLTRIPDQTAAFPTCGFGGIPISPLFAPELVWDAAGAHVVVNAGASYAIDVYTSGRLVRRIRRDVPPRRVTEEMALREAGDGLFIAIANCTVPPREVVQGRGYADVLPSLMQLAVSPDGEVWAMRGRVAGEPMSIDVFASDGEYLGTLPAGSPMPAAFLSDRRIVAVERDSMGVPVLSFYQVVGK